MDKNSEKDGNEKGKYLFRVILSPHVSISVDSDYTDTCNVTLINPNQFKVSLLTSRQICLCYKG